MTVLSRRYVFALGAVALLIVMNQLLVQPALHRLTTDAPVLNVAGRQRMLSQKLTKGALALTAAESREELELRGAELAAASELWTRSHLALREGDSGLSLPGKNSAAVAREFARVEPHFDAMREAGHELREVAADGEIAESERPVAREAVAALLAHEREYLPRMDHIVGLYEWEARGRVASLRATGWGIMGLILAALLGVGVIVVRPASRLIAAQFGALEGARDELERRVAERTRELSEANAALRREAAERRAAEVRSRGLLEQLAHASRLNTMGQMATELAHEINQPLGAIANYAEGCLALIERGESRVSEHADSLVAVGSSGLGHCADDVRAFEAVGSDVSRRELRDALQRISGAALRAGEILRRVRAFVRKRVTDAVPVCVNELVWEVDPLCRPEAEHRGLTLSLSLADELPEVVADSIQIQQVLVNLIRNGIDAVAGAGVREGRIVVATRRISGGVEVSVADTGPGIRARERDRIFAPFVTSRAEGLGMGLAISRSIIEAHEGRLWVESEPGAGATFRFTLPAGGRDAG